MAHAKKLTRKELKKPDEFIQTGQKLMEWATANSTQVLTGISAIIAVGIIVAVASWWMEARAVSAGAALGDALELADRPVLDEVDSAKPEDSYFSSDAEKQETLVAALESVVESHSGTPAAGLATLRLGDDSFGKGEFDEALKRYEAFLKSSAPGDKMRFSALEGVALCHEAKGEGEAAVKGFEALEKEASFYRPFALVEQARVLSSLGRKAEARKRAQTVIDEFSDSPARARADQLLATLPAAAAAKDPEVEGAKVKGDTPAAAVGAKAKGDAPETASDAKGS